MVAFFRAQERGGTEVLLPGPRARSGWGGPGQVRGTAVSGALARASERVTAEWDDAARFFPVRWTVDLFRPAPMAPVSTEATVLRRGRRLRLVESVLRHDDTVVARASALMLATDSPPAAGEVWAAHGDTGWPAPGLLPVPDLTPGTSEQALYFSEGTGWTSNADAHRNTARKATWHRREALVDGETASPFQLVATAADSSNLAGSWGDKGIEFINADLTLSLTRLPRDGSGIGVLAEDRQGDDGIAVVRTSLFDRDGRLGTVMMSTLANSAVAVDPSTVGTPN